MNTAEIIRTLSLLGGEFGSAADQTPGMQKGRPGDGKDLAGLVHGCQASNPWFIPEFVQLSYRAWALALTEEKVSHWVGTLEGMTGLKGYQPQNVGLVMAGNIPMAGLHDLLCVLVSGHHALVKLSSDDNLLIPAVVRVISRINQDWAGRVTFMEGLLKDFDAIVATGSNNSSRYFEYYFGKYPHIIRKNRNGVAILTGNESNDELAGLAADIFCYFGLGCRNVSMLYVPEGYPLAGLFPHFERYRYFSDHSKYRNNYDYQKSVAIINMIPHEDDGFLVMTRSGHLISPLSVLHYQYYKSPKELRSEIHSRADEIQCVVTSDADFPEAVKFGHSQFPELWDYADGVNTMDFLLKLHCEK